MPISTTKLYSAPPRFKTVPRAHLIERLNESLRRMLALISTCVGFGKTTLVNEWADTQDIAQPLEHPIGT